MGRNALMVVRIPRATISHWNQITCMKDSLPLTLAVKTGCHAFVFYGNIFTIQKGTQIRGVVFELSKLSEGP